MVKIERSVPPQSFDLAEFQLASPGDERVVSMDTSSNESSGIQTDDGQGNRSNFQILIMDFNSPGRSDYNLRQAR